MAEKKDYKWQHFWYPREASIPLENGYLSLPLQEYAQYFQDERKTLDQLKDVPCLILLGEPGVRKSSEIGRWATSLREQQQNHYEILEIELSGQAELTLNEERKQQILESVGLLRANCATSTPKQQRSHWLLCLRGWPCCFS